MEEIMGLTIGLVAVLVLFLGLPWMIFHYVTKWKQAPKITVEDERLLDEMFVLARRLEERLTTVERIAAADHPDFRPGVPSQLGAPPQQDWQPGLDKPQSAYTLDRRN